MFPNRSLSCIGILFTSALVPFPASGQTLQPLTQAWPREGLRSGARQEAYVKASNTAMMDRFGSAIAVSGDTVVIGAPGEWSRANGERIFPHLTDSGAVYVFVRKAGGWVQQAYLKAGNAGSSDSFGSSVDISGDTLIVGAPGEDGSSTGVNGPVDDSLPNAGAAYIFTRKDGVWKQRAYLKPHKQVEGNAFGRTVAISGDRCVVGCSKAMEVYVFARQAGAWTPEIYFYDQIQSFGPVVDISGDTVVVGSSYDNFNQGGVHVFTRKPGGWVFDTYLTARNGLKEDRFGTSVAISGDTIAVGAPSEDGLSSGVNTKPNQKGIAAGAGYIFKRRSGAWKQQAYLKASHVASFDEFGATVALDGDTVVFGTLQDDSSNTGINGTPDDLVREAGAAYVFNRSGGAWRQRAYLKPGNVGVQQAFGAALGVQGGRVFVGAPGEESNTKGVNQPPFGRAAGSGAAYFFAGLGPIPVPSISCELPNGDTPDNGKGVLGFGSLRTNGESKRKSILIRNQGAVALTRLKAELSGRNAASFRIESAPRNSLAPGASTVIRITFDPSSAGNHKASLRLRDSAAGLAPFEILLEGKGS